jgi:hypothetical protein
MILKKTQLTYNVMYMFNFKVYSVVNMLWGAVIYDE